ncbi:uncharacterized protein LOC103518569 [Diaphorina citri]|uniref:Uncharacterized protein LOC103518569 n=1 Tax=Diaphorina citri TaxID=121845 RepID=A0A3Q0JCG8_DIACI|nr:uncharacterized protein LOC103518569 [Diaphorina citri]
MYSGLTADAVMNYELINDRVFPFGALYNRTRTVLGDHEYYHILLLEKVVSGDLPCSKEEAATLAGIQLRIEESWGRPVLRDVPSPISPDGPSTTLKPISEDKESFLLEVPTFGPGGNLRPVSPLMEDAEGEEGETDSKKPPSGVTTPGYQKTIAVPCAPLSNVVKPSQSILSRCYPFSSSTVPFLPSGRIEDCLPPCYREQAKYMSKLIKVSPLALLYMFCMLLEAFVFYFNNSGFNSELLSSGLVLSS